MNFNDYFYKYKKSRKMISNLNIYSIIKKKFLNYFIIFQYQTLFIDQVLNDKFLKKNSKTKLFFNQV